MARYIDPVETQEFARCSRDPWHFIMSYCRINDPTLGVITFSPWQHLFQLLQLILGNNRVIVLKSRQIGVSWLLAALALWFALFTPSANILIFSRRETEAEAMKERAFFMWRHLPKFLQVPVGKNNNELMTFPSMNSKIQSFPATEGSGRMEAATLVVLDEWAFQPEAEANWSGILPTVEKSKIVGVSTANGKGNLFYDIYMKAKNGKNSFIPVFIPYTVRPGRDEAWHEQQKQDMPLYLALQEYPLKESDAFIVAGTCMFSVEALNALPTRSPQITSLIHSTMDIFAPYNPDHIYSAGVDLALGISDRDFHALEIIDNDTGDLAAKIHNQIPVEQFVEDAAEALVRLGYPMTCVEEQPQGRLMVAAMKARGHPTHKIYHRSKNIPCWHTTSTNRSLILSELEVGIRTGEFTIHSSETIDELLGFGYNERENKFEALAGHDDEVMACALAWHMRCTRIAPLGDMEPKSYIDTGEAFTTLEDIDWRKSDPFSGIEIVTCPGCGGERFIEGDECDTCLGAGQVMKRGTYTRV